MRFVLGLIIFLVVLVAPAAAWIPNDPGQSGVPGGWQQDQWNFMPGTGVDAPRAWDNLIAAGRPGGRGVTIAIVDSGVAFRRSPDLNANRFTRGYDFCARKGRGDAGMRRARPQPRRRVRARDAHREHDRGDDEQRTTR